MMFRRLMLECITKVSSIRGGEMLFVCDWEMVPTMGEKNYAPHTQFTTWKRLHAIFRLA